MPFDPSQPFSVEGEGGTAVADAPKGFDPSQPFTVEDAPVDPVTQGQQNLASISSGQTPLPATPQMLEQGADGVYRTSALARDAKAIGGALFSNTATPDYAADEGGFAQGLRAIPLAGPLLANLGHGIGNLASSAYDTAMDSRDTARADVQKNGVFPAMLHQTEAIGAGLPGAAYGVINPFANLIETGAKDVISDGIRAAGGIGNAVGLGNNLGDTAANFEAQKDFDRYQYQKQIEQPAQQALLASSPNQALTTATQNVAPLLLPGGIGLETAGINAKLGALVGDATTGGAKLVSKGIPYVSPLAGAIEGGAHYGLPGVVGGLYTGSKVANVGAKLLDATAPAIGNAVGDLTTLGLNAAAPVATGAVLGLGSADPGQEEDAARAGASQGALFSPVTAMGGTFARQDMEQSALAKQAAVRGMAEYGDSPAQDASTARGISMLSPEDQRAVLEQRGIYREIQNPEGKQIQIHVPDNYAEGAAAANGGTVDDAANSRGYYLDGQGKVFVNPEAADVPGALQEALGHEVGHSVYQDALPAVNDRAATRLTNAVTNDALDENLQPTPKFQSFIDQYATAANGKPSTVDWNSLPVSGPEGLTRTKLINEAGAETVRAATPDVGAQLAGPELSNKISDFASDLATRIGLKSAPDLTAAFGQGDAPVPVGVSALRAARKGTYAVGQQAADSFGSPVRISDPDPVPKVPAVKPVKASPVSTTPYRDTPAYKDALTNLTLSKKFGGQGVSPMDARTLLDRAALDLTVPDTAQDYQDYVKKATVPSQSTSAPGQSVNAPANQTAPTESQAQSQSATPASPQPDTSFRQTQAYQDALAVATLPKKSGGLGVDPASAQATLDKAAQDSSVPDNVTSYVGYVQKAQTPAPATQAAVPSEPEGVTTSVTPSPFPNVPTVSPQAKRIYLLPGGPGGAKRIELPQAQPVLTLPTAEPSAQRVVLPKAEPVNRFAGMDEPPVTGPTDKQLSPDLPPANTPLENGQASPRLPEQSTDDTGRGDTSASSSPDTQTQASADTSRAGPSSSDVNPGTSTVASPLSSEAIARIESEAEAAHQPNPYPRSSPESRAQKQAADLAKAQADAVAKAHADALPEGDTRVQQRVDPETGRTSFSGTHLVAGDALHDPILAGLSDRDKSQLSSIQDAIQSGSALNVDYHSAPELEAGSATTSAKRQAAQTVSTGAARAVGEAPSVLQKGKEYFPQSISSSNGNVYVHGVNIDKFIGNANKTIDLFNQEGRPSPYQDVNSPDFIKDVQGYFRNHANSVSGDGKTPLKGTDAIPVPPTPEGYEPYQLSKDKADFINLALRQEGAKVPSRGSKVPSERIQAFARANGIEPTEAGEVNSLRQSVNDAGNFKVDDATGTKQVLEDPLHETIRLDNIQDLRPSQGDVADPSNLRAQGFRGARGDLTAGGLPNARAAAAGFLPAREAGAGTPERVARTDESTGLPLNSDGTVTLYHGTTKDNADKIRQSGIIRSAAEPDVYFTTAKEGTGYGDGTVVAVKVDPSKLELDDEFPDGRQDYKIHVGSKKVLPVRFPK